jgi:hypothetical protein
VPIGAGVSGAAACIPELLLPAILALLEAPGLPTPGLGGCSATASSVAAGFGSSNSSSSAAAGGQLAGDELTQLLQGLQLSSSCSVVWYDASNWWWADRRVEGLVEGLDTGHEHLQRQLAAMRLQQLLAAAVASDSSTASTSSSYLAAASSVVDSSGEGLVGLRGQGFSGSAAAEVEGSNGLAVWWRCWCQLADGAAEALTQVGIHNISSETSHLCVQRPAGIYMKVSSMFLPHTPAILTLSYQKRKRASGVDGCPEDRIV